MTRRRPGARWAFGAMPGVMLFSWIVRARASTESRHSASANPSGIDPRRYVVPRIARVALFASFFASALWASGGRASDALPAAAAGASVEAASAETDDTGVEVCPAPTGCLALADVLDLALSANPSLKAFAWKLRAADAHTVQAGKRPNPRLSVTADELRLSQGPKTVTHIARYGDEPQTRERIEAGTSAGFSDAELNVGLSQELELGGKRAKRVHLAQQEHGLRTQEYEVLKAQVTCDAKALFYTLLVLQEYLAACDEPLQYTENLVNRLRDGGFPLEDVNAAEVTRAKYEVEREKTKRQIESARIRLAGTWGATQAQFDRVTGSPDPEKRIPAPEKLLKLLSGSPGSGKCAAQIESARARLELEKANAIPNVELRCAFRADRTPDRHASGIGIGDDITMEQRSIRPDGRYDNTVMIGFSMDLPLFDRKQGAIEEARDGFANARAEGRAALLSAKTDVLGLREEMAAAFEEIDMLHARVIPTITQTLEAVKKGMESGAFTQFDLMKAVKEMHDAQRQLLEARIAYFDKQAVVEELIGRSLTEAEGGGEE